MDCLPEFDVVVIIVFFPSIFNEKVKIVALSHSLSRWMMMVDGWIIVI
jgi:hypothetical protein